MKNYLWMIIWLVSATATAQTQAEKSVIRGWSATGNEIYVDREHVGELMVEHESKSYFFETTTTYSSKDGKLIHTYKRGEASGAEHPDFAQARSEDQLKKVLENSGLAEAVESWMSPDARWVLTTAESRTFGEDQRCQHRQRAMLFDSEEQKVYVVFDQTSRGEPNSAQSLTSCPQSTLRAFWNPSGKQWVLERRQQKPDAVWKLYPGRIDALDQFADSGFISNEFANQIVSFGLDENPEKRAWRRAFTGDIKGALAAVMEDTGSSPRKVLMMALFFAMENNAAAAKKTLKEGARQLSSKDAFDTGLQAAVWTVVNDSKQATRLINLAVKQANSYQELARLAAVFSLVDLNLSNEIFVHALSHESAKEADTELIYSAFIEGLLDARQFEAAEGLLNKIGTLNSAQKVLQASLRVSENRPAFARPAIEQILLAEPGRCRAYAVSARLAALDRRSAEALEHFRVASVCNPMLSDAAFFVADLELRRGNVDLGKSYFEKYLKHTQKRRNDPVRDVRLDHAQKSLERLKHQGLVVLSASCLPTGSSTLCQATVANRSDQTINGAQATLSTKDRRGRLKSISSAEIQELAPNEVRSISLSVDTKPDVMSAGTNPAEHTRNQVELIL